MSSTTGRLYLVWGPDLSPDERDDLESFDSFTSVTLSLPDKAECDDRILSGLLRFLGLNCCLCSRVAVIQQGYAGYCDDHRPREETQA